MSRRYRPITEEIAAPTTVGAASTVSDSSVVRAVNTASSSPYLITLANNDGDTIGTMTLLGGQEVFIDKAKTNKIFAANAAVKLTGVSYPS